MIPSKTLLIITSLNLFFSLISCSDISSKFKAYKLVPDVIPSAPKERLQVTYTGGQKSDLGNMISPEDTLKPPELYWKANPDQYYLFAMIDPDYPGPGIPQYFHWIIGNIPGNDLCKGQVLAPYVNPQPPPKKGPHRYTFLIFKQPGIVDFKKNLFLSTNRKHPKLEIALKFYNIDTRPVAGNFFLSQKK